jgi:hypothetical protein
MSLASCEYGRGIDEFIKSGFSKERARLVKPPMVREARAKLECEVIEIKPLGHQGGAGNLVICKVVYIHIDDDVCTDDGKIDPSKLELVARLGGAFYSSVGRHNLFTLSKPARHTGIGMDALPEYVRASRILTGNELAQLANIEEMPVLNEAFKDELLEGICTYLARDRKTEALHRYAGKLIGQGQIEAAWQVLLREMQMQEEWLMELS